MNGLDENRHSFWNFPKSGKPFCGMGSRFNPEYISKYLFGYILSDLMRSLDVSYQIKYHFKVIVR